MATERRVEYVRLDDLRPAPRNPKRHDTDAIGASVDRFGVGELPLIDERTGRLVAGHGRWEDLLSRAERGDAPPDGVRVDEDGQWLMPVVRGWASRSDAEAEAYLIASNRLTERGGWNDDALAASLKDIAGADDGLLGVTGYDADDLQKLLDAVAPPDLSGFRNLDEVARRNSGTGTAGDRTGSVPSINGSEVTCPECGHEFIP